MRRDAFSSVGIWLGLVTAVALLSGCNRSEVLIAHSVDLQRTAVEVAEDQLLDIAITVFDPGVPEGEIDRELLEELIADGTYVQIRRAESRYMAVELRETLQRAGTWGAVWVTPSPTSAADINITAQIVESDGSLVNLRVQAADSTGRVWINDRYEMETAAGAFNRARHGGLDPYQDVFNAIANDLAAARARLSEDDTRQVRQVAQMRYAADLTPEAFDGYVTRTRNGRYQLARLPASDDPTFDRTLRVRQREQLFMETMGQHYATFSRDIRPSYDGWREFSREESIAIREVTRSARWRTGLGIATLVSAVVYGTQNSNSFAERVIRDAMVYMGTEILRTGMMRRQEKRLHTMNLEEISGSFEDELRPMVVQIEGTTHRLQGTADAQYQEWRDLLRRLFTAETGFAPEGMEIYIEPEPDPDDRVPSLEEPVAGSSAEVSSNAGGGAGSGA